MQRIVPVSLTSPARMNKHDNLWIFQDAPWESGMAWSGIQEKTKKAGKYAGFFMINEPAYVIHYFKKR